MITAFRRYLETWVVRAFFLIMVLSFIVWGVGDVVRMIGRSTWVAKVGGQTIEAPTFQSEFQRDMAQATRNLPPGQEASADLKRQVGEAALQRVVGQAAMTQELQRLRLVTPDAAVRQQVLSIPAFRGSNGQFDRQVFETVLRNNGLTEGRFLELMRSDISRAQLLGAITAGATVSDNEARQLYAAEFERRSAEIVDFPISGATQVATPDQTELERWYDNHPDLYSTPELRRIKAIELTPESVSKDIQVSDEELHAAYDQRRSQYQTPARRTAEVISAPDEAKAKELADEWAGGGDWTAVQKTIQQNGGSGVELSNATEAEFPDPDLGRAVFAAKPGAVVGPVKGALGWHVLKVTKETPGTNRSFDEVKSELRTQVLAGKATDLMYDRANKVDNLLGNGTPLDEMPSDLGLVGIAGTLDAHGNTKDGDPAPIPGPPELKAALIERAFQLQKGDPPQLTEVQTPSTGGSAYYALSVEDVIPPAKRPFEDVKDKVAEDWTADQERRAAEQSAAKVLAALKSGQTMADAAAVSGRPVSHTPLIPRGGQAEGVAPELQRVLFSLKKGEPTMVQTPDAFIVADPVEIQEPDPAADQGGFTQLRQAITQSIGSDLTSVFAAAVRQRANPQVNDKNFAGIVQPQ